MRILGLPWNVDNDDPVESQYSDDVADGVKVKVHAGNDPLSSTDATCATALIAIGCAMTWSGLGCRLPTVKSVGGALPPCELCGDGM